MSFLIFQNEKTPFQALKTRHSKGRKIKSFPKGLTHCLGPKPAIFPIFFLRNIGQENVLYDILERKTCILGYKNKSFKKSKTCHFSKGVKPWFWSKNGHFSNFFFSQYRPGKCLLLYFRAKNSFLGYKNKKSKKSKT